MTRITSVPLFIDSPASWSIKNAAQKVVELESRGKRILFFSIENSSRSVIAEAFANKLGLQASSAGTVPSSKVNPIVVKAMGELSIDVSAS